MYINTTFEDYVSSENMYIFLQYCVVSYDKAPSISSQIIEQIEVIQEAVLSGVSKLNDSAMKNEQEDQTNFLPNKHPRNRKWICYYLLYSLGITPID